LCSIIYSQVDSLSFENFIQLVSHEALVHQVCETGQQSHAYKASEMNLGSSVKIIFEIFVKSSKNDAFNFLLCLKIYHQMN